MTRYEKGFIEKCAEAGLSQEQAVSLMKAAQQHVKSEKQPDTGDTLKITSGLTGVTTTNGPSGLPVMPGSGRLVPTPYMWDDKIMRKKWVPAEVDIDPVTGLTGRSGNESRSPTMAELSSDSLEKLLGQTGDNPLLSPLGTNVVDKAVERLYPSNNGKPFRAKKDQVGIPRRGQWNSEPYSSEDYLLRTKWKPGWINKNLLTVSPDYDATAKAIQDRYRFLSDIFGSKDKTK